MMNYRAWMTFPLVAVVFAFVYMASVSGPDMQALAIPPLSLDGYRDEKLPEAPKKKVEVKVDNGACYVCHGNYDGEELALTHAKEAVGCADCHGVSYDHRDDEDNITPPDTMYPADKIDEACRECHDTHDVPATEVIARWQKRCPSKTDASKLVCTDCHGQHRLKRRTVRWDKKTRKLIIGSEKETEASAGSTAQETDGADKKN
jgi:formate-dependent nitrite reductase cytochrome c552 subunit